MSRQAAIKPRTAAKRLALVALVTGLLVAILAMLVPPSSASPFLRPQTRVAAIATPESQLVGLNEAVLPGGSRPRAPDYDLHATGSSVAAESAGDGAASAGGGEFGPFYRLESPTQTPEVAQLQEQSGEIWGKASRYSNMPSVKAYNGPLPEGARGIEFSTPVEPTDVGLGKSGQIASWYQGSPGVQNVNDEWVKITCTVASNTQC